MAYSKAFKAKLKTTVKHHKPTQKQVANEAQKLANKIVKDQLVSNYSEPFNQIIGSKSYDYLNSRNEKYFI